MRFTIIFICVNCFAFNVLKWDKFWFASECTISVALLRSLSSKNGVLRTVETSDSSDLATHSGQKHFDDGESGTSSGKLVAALDSGLGVSSSLFPVGLHLGHEQEWDEEHVNAGKSGAFTLRDSESNALSWDWFPFELSWLRTGFSIVWETVCSVTCDFNIDRDNCSH